MLADLQAEPTGQLAFAVLSRQLFVPPTCACSQPEYLLSQHVLGLMSQHVLGLTSQHVLGLMSQHVLGLMSQHVLG
jgi:hypothetical protein